MLIKRSRISPAFKVLEKDDDYVIFPPRAGQLHAFGVPYLQAVVFCDWK